MHFKNYSFSNLPFSTLFQTYIDDFEELASYYSANPFELQAIKQRADNFKFSGDRQKTVNFLLQYNQRFGADEKAIANIKKLKSDDTVALVTGQQLGLFGGPLYTFFKAITTIYRARQLEKQLSCSVVPVFWMADEDHDFEEIRSINILGQDGLKSFSLPQDTSNQPVSDIEFPAQIDKLKTDLRSALNDTDFSEELWALLDRCFTPGEKFVQGFSSFLSKIFSKHGLILAGSNNREAKEITVQPLVQSVKHHEAVFEALKRQTEKLQKDYYQQVKLYDSHLFYLDDDNGRIKINHNTKGWSTANGKQWSSQALIDEIERNPEKFSPDVFLRPVVQDELLPTLGYVSGPGETAYYGQMKELYKVFNMEMPFIFPRLSGTFVEPAIVRIFQELPFEINDYLKRIEDLESEFAKNTEEIEVEELFGKWKNKIEHLQLQQTNVLTNIDKTLEGASKKVMSHYFNELNKLKGKTYRAIKKNESIQVKRIHRIQRNIFPKRNLQERTISGIYYMNKFGVDIWDQLLEELDDDLTFQQHKLVYL